MSDIDSYLDQSILSARIANAGAQDDDPEQAARALELSDATGDPATAIYGDIDGYEKAHKAALGGQIISDNQFVANWLNSHPMAPRVAHDDLGALDDTSRAVQALPEESGLKAWLKSDSIARSFENAFTGMMAPPKAFSEGFGNQPIGSSVFSRPNDLEWATSHPLMASVAAAVATPPEVLARTTGGLLGIGHEQVAKYLGESWANELQAMAEWAMMRGDMAAPVGGELPFHNTQLASKMADVAHAVDLAEPWTKIDKEPLLGLHPLIDDAIKTQSRDDISALDEALSTAAKSATRERAPDLFANFIRDHIGDRQIGIDPEAVRSLYGDEVPTADDGKLGFVQDLQKQLEAAEVTGDDVKVPMADWLAKVDPEIAKQLHDDIRVRDNGMTVNESKIEAEPKQAVADPVAMLRGAGGMEPLAAAGDRKIALQRMDALRSKEVFGDQSLEHDEEVHDHDILDENGKSIGFISLSERDGGKKLWIHNIQAGPEHSEFYQPQYLGPGLIRDLKAQLKAAYPNAEKMAGYRVTGARDRANKIGEASIKLDLGEDPQTFRDLLQPYWDFLNPSSDIEILRGPFNEEGKQLNAAVEAELKRIAPQADHEMVHSIFFPKVGGSAAGIWSPRMGKIFTSLESKDVVGTARHEAIHSLRAMDLIREDEWLDLKQEAKLKRWRERFNIDKNYANFTEDQKDEEAIAEAYRYWRRGEDIIRDPTVFQRIKDFIDMVHRRIKEALGRDFTWEEIFKDIDTGRIGRREQPFEADFGDEAASTNEGSRFPKGYYEKVSSERRLSRTGISHPGFRWEVYDRQTGKVVRKDLETGVGANRSVDRLDNQYGGYRYAKRAVRAKELTEEESKFLEDNQIDLDSDQGEVAHIEEPTGEEPGFGIYDRGKALGVTQSHMDRMLSLIQKRNEEDLQAANRRAEVRQRRRSNKEFKERRTVLRDDVSNELQQRPDIALDKLMSRQKVKFNPAYLTEDQRARLPKEYIQKKDGINPDDLAPYFGYTSGDALVERLGMLTEDRRRAGMSQRDYFNRLVDVETDRRLNQEFGDREQNILDEAKDQALSETQLNLVHEETMAYAYKAHGPDFVPQFGKDQVRDMVRSVFNDTPVGSISSDRMIQTAGKIGKKIEEAGSKGDWATAYRLSQQRNHAMIAAKFAREYEKSRQQLDRVAKQFRKREVASVPAEYTNWVHDILQRVGYPINRSIQDLAENIGRASEDTLRDFKDAKEALWMGMRELPVADFLMDPAFRQQIDKLPYTDFMGLKVSIDALVKAGRDEKKIITAGETMDREAALDEMRDKLESFGYKPSNVEPSRLTKWPRAWIYGLTNKETLLNRWDRGDKRGIFNRLITYPLADAANAKATLQREIARDYQALPPIKDLDKLVDAPFPNPMSRTRSNPNGDGPWPNFRKSHVISMLLNAGNDSNWKVLAHGYGVDPDVLWNWLGRNITKEDLDFATGLGKIFKKLVGKADNVYERMTGATIEKIPLNERTFKLADGTEHTVPGWYHPLIADPQMKTVWVQDPDTGLWSQKAQGKRETFDDLDFLHFSTSNGYTKKRTGAIYPLDLNFNSTPTRIKQMIHDIAFREVIHEVQKIYGDPRFREDVSKYYGKEYADGLMPYLRGVAGSEGIASKNLAEANQLSELIRQNVISTYIGFNPFTVLKHGPTAAVMSIREVGLRDFASAVKTLYGQSPSVARMTHKFIEDNSEEIQRRERNWQDTVVGQGKEIEGAGNLREKIIQKGSAAVAWSDRVSAKPTWLAAYNRARADGLSHGESISLGDRAVRRAHGSTAETNQPPLVQSGGPLHAWLTSVYGFFGTAMQRRIETAHKLNDAWELGKQRDINAASRKLASVFGDFMTYMVWPTIVEEAVQGLGTDDHRTIGSRLISGATMGMSSSVLYLRDLIHGAISGHEPSVGLLSSALHDVGEVFRDVGRGTDALSARHAGKTVGDFLTLAGEATGMSPKIVANAARYGINVAEGQEKPKTPADVLLGVTKGTQKRRVVK